MHMNFNSFSFFGKDFYLNLFITILNNYICLKPIKKAKWTPIRILY